MKKIFLLMKYYIDSDVKTRFPKYKDQIIALENLGYDVYYLAIKGNQIYLTSSHSEEYIAELRNSSSSLFSLFYIYGDLYKATNKVFTSSHAFDFAYIRYLPVTPTFKTALKSIKKNNCRVIVEFPAFPVEKELVAEKSAKRKIFLTFSHLYFLTCKKYIDLFTLIGEKASTYHGRPALNITNGINVENLPLKKNVLSNDNIHMIAVANVCTYHGYDRIIEGMKKYRDRGGTRQIYFHIIGPDSDGSLEQLKSLVKKYNLCKQVIFEGPVFGEKLHPYYDKCQVAIGMLGTYRKNAYINPTLKAGEYMARGIPFVESSIDPRFDKNFSYRLLVPNDDSPIEIEEIIAFVQSMNQQENVSTIMRTYAKEYMQWETQFKKVVSFFDNYNQN